MMGHFARGVLLARHGFTHAQNDLIAISFSYPVLSSIIWVTVYSVTIVRDFKKFFFICFK